MQGLYQPDLHMLQGYAVIALRVHKAESARLQYMLCRVTLRTHWQKNFVGMC